MSLFFGLIMFICLVPATLIIFFQIYPKNWKEKKLIFGVKNRDEFREGTSENEVDAIVKKRRSQAGIIVICTCVIAGLLLLVRGMPMQTTIWTAFIFIALIVLEFPYILGNREMKELKKSLGLGSETGVSFVDLSSAGAVHALQPFRIWLPVLLGLVPVALALLIDLKILFPGMVPGAGSFLVTATLGVFWLVSIMMAVFAHIFDNMKNEVISHDSSINANYNRAKKKNFADMFVLGAWGNLLLLAAWLLAFILAYSDLTIIISSAVYILFIFAGIASFVIKSKKIDSRYEKEMDLLADDDDHWILGLLYYNPKDRRLNVEKRAGVGGTVNVGHPAGKVILGLSVLALVGVIVSLVWIGMIESTPMTVKFENRTVICHQISDDYVIALDDIRSISYGEDPDELNLIRTHGIGTATIQKGSFTVNGETGCKVFLRIGSGNYIKIVTDSDTYYINASTEEETADVYKQIDQAFSLSAE